MKFMKTKSILLLAVMSLGLVFTSCLKDQEDIFDKSPSVRMTEYLAEAQKVLMSPEKGWLMCYYPDNAQRYGGCSYAVKFDKESVEVGCELAPGTTVTSLYSMGSDNGPILTFDTYNELMHIFSTPSSGMYQGYGGDFEFMLIEVEADHIKMMGRRSGNIIYMYPMTEDMETYFNGVNKMAGDFVISGMEGTVGGQQVSARLDLSYQQVYFTIGEESVKKAFMYTPAGIRLYEPVEIGEVEVWDLNYDSETFKLTIGSTSESLQGIVPEGYRRFAYYEGDYWLIFNKEDDNDEDYDSLRVTLTPDPSGTSYKMSGINENYDIVWEYNKTAGALTWSFQALGNLPNGWEVRLCAYDGKSGYFTWTDTVYGATEWNGDEASPVYKIVPQYTWSSTRHSNSFYLCCWDGSTRKSAPASDTGWRFPKNQTSMKYLHSLVKIN